MSNNSHPKAKNRVIVAMSGGVDSSVAAAILKNQGYDVCGVFMHFWAENFSEKLEYKATNRCCSIEAQEMARRVAQKLNIPFYTLNFERDFKKYVVDYFISEYKNGRTPNPCVMCNKFIKFDFLLKKVLFLGADFLATGHYVKTKNQKPKTKNTNQKPKNAIKLFMAKDRNKDQSYFLYNLTQSQLAHLIFPLGNYTKPQVRALARKWGLPTATRPESQEICFILDNDINRFLKRYVKNIKPGKIVDQNGREIGEHQGLSFYTLGQRKNIRLSGGPYYVFAKDAAENILYVTNNPNDKKLFSKNLTVNNVNWISGIMSKLPLLCEVKIRYRTEAVKAKIAKKLDKNTCQIRFNQAVRAITPGQSAVFYRGEELIGGGVIKEN